MAYLLLLEQDDRDILVPGHHQELRIESDLSHKCLSEDILIGADHATPTFLCRLADLSVPFNASTGDRITI